MARTLTLAYAGLCVAAFFATPAAIVAMVLALSAAVAMKLLTGVRLGGGRAVPPDGAEHDVWWRAQTFSFLVAGVFQLPVVLLPGSWIAVALISLCFALAMLSALTPFCLGRFFYVVLLEGTRRQQC